MSDVKIKELDKSLIHRANSNSMGGQRGDISAHEYEVYCQKVMSWNISDSRKQKSWTRFILGGASSSGTRQPM